MANVVNRGEAPFDSNADTLYAAFGKVNDKFAESDDLKQVQTAVEKVTPVDADNIPLIDSEAGAGLPKLKWLSWANIKATLKTYFDTLYSNLVLGTTSSTAHRGDLGTTAYNHSQDTHAPANATANDTDANLKARANHTGTQLAATISDFAATVRSTVLTGLSLTTNAVIAATDTVLSALGKLQKQITDHETTHPAPTNRDTRNEPANANIQTHVTSAHAPSDAQKNSDITKAEIEAKLTGEISSHSHAGGSGGLVVTTDLNGDITLNSSHAGKYIPVNSASTVNITINGSVFAANNIIAFEQTGNGIATIVQGTGMTLNGGLKTWGQDSVIQVFFKSATVATVIGGIA